MRDGKVDFVARTFSAAIEIGTHSECEMSSGEPQ
jgi:hypothetical protein